MELRTALTEVMKLDVQGIAQMENLHVSLVMNVSPPLKDAIMKQIAKMEVMKKAVVSLLPLDIVRQLTLDYA